MINESEILFLGLSTVVYVDRLELGFIFKRNDFIYVVVDARLSDIDDSIDGITIVTWLHTVRIATDEERIAYEVMQT